MGPAVDKGLLLLIQYEVRDLVKEFNAIKLQMIQHHERLRAMEKKLQEAAAENRSREIEKVLERLLSFEAQISIRLQTLEEKFDQLEQTHTVTADEVELLKHSHRETAAKVDQLGQKCNVVEEIGQELKSLITQNKRIGKLSL